MRPGTRALSILMLLTCVACAKGPKSADPAASSAPLGASLGDVTPPGPILSPTSPTEPIDEPQPSAPEGQPDPIVEGPNLAPIVVSVGVDGAQHISNAEIFFDANATDPDGDALVYTWDFGDGLRGAGQTVSHRFWGLQDGWSHTVTLTVDDQHGHTVTHASSFTTFTPPHRDLPNAPPYAASGWTQGHKRILIMVPVFAGQGSAAALTNPVTAYLQQAQDYISRVSGGALTIELELTGELPLSQDAPYYDFVSGEYWDLQRETRELARKSGFNPDDYDLDVTLFDGALVNQTRSTAQSYGRGMILNNAQLSSFLHELGHNLGFGHSNVWNSSYDVFGPGDEVIYGCPWDLMGNVGPTNLEYGALLKARSGWLSEVQVLTIEDTSDFELYAHDQGSYENAKTYAAKLQASDREYWLEYRTSIANPYLQNGLIVIGTANHDAGSDVVFDTTPASSHSAYGPAKGAELIDDSALTIGRSITLDGEFHVTVLGATGGALKIGVVHEAPGTNKAPTITTLSAQTQTPKATDVVQLSVTAADPDNDGLVYAWDFGDGTFTTDSGASTTSKAWDNDGFYIVSVEVSDQRGGVARRILVMSVGDVTQLSSYLVSGNVTAGAAAAPATRVTAQPSGAPSIQGFSDSIGAYAIVVPAGTYQLRGAKLGKAFFNVNGVVVGATPTTTVNLGGGNAAAGIVFNAVDEVKVAEDGILEDLDFTITDSGAGALASRLLSLTVSSDNPALLSHDRVSVGWNQKISKHRLTLLAAPHGNGVAHITISANDGVATVTHEITVTVYEVDDAPLARHDSYPFAATDPSESPATLRANVLDNDSEFDGATLTASLVAAATHGEVELSSDGAFSYVPKAGFHGHDYFVYEAADTTGLTATAVVDILVP